MKRSGIDVTSAASLGRRRKPTKGDLIALVSIAAHEAGSAVTCYQNDRQPNRAAALCNRLELVQKHMLEAVAHFPPPRRSPWDLPNAEPTGAAAASGVAIGSGGREVSTKGKKS